jgi:hypothetical protein
MNIPLIKIGEFTFRPIHYYKVEQYDITIYKLKYRDIECTIPYYVSLGETNNFKANLLLPFICFSLDYSLDCPRTIKLNKKGLLKYNICVSINKDKIIDQFKKLLEKEFTNSVLSPNIPGYIEKLKKDHLKDIYSVLQRFLNLLDFIIMISSFNEDITIDDTIIQYSANPFDITFRGFMINFFKECKEKIRPFITFLHLSPEEISMEVFNKKKYTKLYFNHSVKKNMNDYLEISKQFYFFMKSEESFYFISDHFKVFKEKESDTDDVYKNMLKLWDIEDITEFEMLSFSIIECAMNIFNKQVELNNNFIDILVLPYMLIASLSISIHTNMSYDFISDPPRSDRKLDSPISDSPISDPISDSPISDPNHNFQTLERRLIILYEKYMMDEKYMTDLYKYKTVIDIKLLNKFVSEILLNTNGCNIKESSLERRMRILLSHHDPKFKSKSKSKSKTKNKTKIKSKSKTKTKIKSKSKTKNKI